MPLSPSTKTVALLDETGELVRSPATEQLFTSNALLAAGGNDASGIIDLSRYDTVRVGKASTGGVYAFEIDWVLDDGATVAFTETATPGEKAGIVRNVLAPFARFRVRNTDGLNAFTAHRTIVSGR
jgi:hypothetical protein